MTPDWFERTLSPAEVERSRKVLYDVFKHPKFAAPDYLDWLYRRNPSGVALTVNYDEGDRRLGHSGAIPQDFVNIERRLSGVMSLNGVLLEEARGKGLYQKLNREFYDQIDRYQIQVMTGVGNRYSAPSVHKTGMAILGNLRVIVFFRLPKSSAGVSTITVTDDFVKGSAFDALAAELNYGPYGPTWEPHWYPEKLRWRLQDPCGDYRIHGNETGILITTKIHQAGIPFVVVLKSFRRGAGSRFDYNPLLRAAAKAHRTPLFVYAGQRSWFDVRGIPVPAKWRPSPLTFVHRPFRDAPSLHSLDDIDGFEFFDFDAY